MVAASILESNGFENVYNFPGGVAEWRDDGFNVE
jgi:rhodanese-related sulfurtransferase